MHKKHRFFISCAATVTYAFFCLPAKADDYWWSGSQNSFWNTGGGNTPTNFSINSSGSGQRTVLPGLDDVVLFAVAGTTQDPLATSLGQDFSIRGVTSDAWSASPIIVSGNKLTVGTVGIQHTGGTSMTVNSEVTSSESNLLVRVTSTEPLHIAGVISGAQSLRLTGDSLLKLSGNNTYTGGTSITGSIELLNSSALGSGNITFLSGGGLIYSSQNQVDYSSRIENSTGPIRVSTAGQTVVFASSLSSSNVGGLTKVGAGTLTLTASNSYSGNTAVAGGVLQIGNGGTTGNVNGSLQNNSSVVFNRADSVTFSDVISGSGSVTKLGNGVLSLTASNTNTGTITIESGTVQVGVGGTSGAISGNVQVNGASLVFNRSDDSTYSRVVAGTGTLTKLGAGTLTITGANTFTGTTTVSGGTLQVGNGGITGSFAGDIVNDAAVIFNRSGLLVYSGSISGNGSLTKLGSGTVRLIGDNLFDGTTTISAGTLQIGGGTSGSFTGDIVNDANVTFGRSDDVEYSGVISGSGTISKISSGTLFLSGNSTFSGTTTISSGAIQIGDDDSSSTSGNLGGLIVNNASFVLNRSDDFTLSSLVTGSGTIKHQGSGTTSLEPGKSSPYSTSSLVIADGALHVSDNDLIVNYTGASPISTIIGYILNEKLGADGDVGGLPTQLAVAEANDLGITIFGGVAVDATSILAKFTYVGDLDLNGQVDALDYERVDLAIGNTGVVGVAQGDGNYDGVVDALDYELVDLNIGNGVGSPLSPVVAARFIPEPLPALPVGLLAFLFNSRTCRRY